MIEKLMCILNNNDFIYNYYMDLKEPVKDTYVLLSSLLEEEFDIKCYDASKKGLYLNHGMLFMKRKRG